MNAIDPTGLCADQLDSPRRCIVEHGDTTWQIAYDRGLNYDMVVAWNQKAKGSNWNPRLIYPGDIMYLEDPALSQPVKPIPVNSGQLFNSYIEGTGVTFSAAFNVWSAEGKEVVYDFETLQRAEFTYIGEPYLPFGSCGVTNELLALGKSWYTGFFHFMPNQSIDAYSGLAESISVGFGGINPLDGPLGAYDVGGQVAVFASANRDTLPFGIPSQTNYENRGVTISVSEGGSWSPRMPISVGTMLLHYSEPKNIKQYYSVKDMQNDIASGVGTGFGVDDLVGLTLFSRLFFAGQQLPQMYGLPAVYTP